MKSNIIKHTQLKNMMFTFYINIVYYKFNMLTMEQLAKAPLAIDKDHMVRLVTLDCGLCSECISFTYPSLTGQIYSFRMTITSNTT